MIRNLKDIEELSEEPYDLCIIGTGPASIVLCSELAGTKLRICVLESGGLSKNNFQDRLRNVFSEGMTIKDHSRERVFGGASTTWSGLSSLLDPIDMADRPFLKVPGWPIGYDELVPYWKAAERYRFPFFEAFEEFAGLREKGQLRPVWNRISEKIFLGSVPPQRFAAEFGSVFQKESIDLFYNATVLRLEASANKTGSIDRAAVVSSARTHIVRAKYFVLATGGIENARLLLSSTDLCPHGLGNEHDQVGRYFMNHPKNNYGTVTLSKPVTDAPYFFGCLWNGYAGFAGLRINEKIQHQLGILNSYVRFDPLFPWSNNDGVESVIFLAKKIQNLLKYWKKSKTVTPLRDYAETGDDSLLQNKKYRLGDYAKMITTILWNMPVVIRYTLARLSRKHKPVIRKMRLRNFMEMEPHPDNRVILSAQMDANGQRIPLVRHAPTELDRQSLIKLHEILKEELSALGIGSLDGDLGSEIEWPINQDASHHMGATRMGDDRKTSVVNKDLRLHGAWNVYCAGSSVFPTSGCANPTYTICALSIRLAEHLKRVSVTDGADSDAGI
jgi:choline dehydrogenase-like flavoprotein